MHAGGPIKASYLVDPVDGGPFEFIKMPPSAIEALKAKGNLQLGITGMGVTGYLNPEWCNYKAGVWVDHAAISLLVLA